jgi:hypothetical protein
LIPVVLNFVHGVSVACQCTEPAPAAIAFVDADVVLFGEIISEWTDEDNVYSWRHLTVRVQKSWRGVTGTEVGVITEPLSSGCGTPAVLGDELLIYATEYSSENRVLHVSACSRSATGAEVWEDLNEFTRLGLKPLELVEGADPNYPPEENPAEDPVEVVADPCGSGMLPALIALTAALSALRGWRLTWRRFAGAQ